jgi:HemY protein
MRLLLLLCFIALCVFIGLGIARDPGYLFLSYQEWTVEMPLWLGLMLMFLSMLAFYLVFKLIETLIEAPSSTKAWLRDRHLQRVRRRTIRGYIAFAEGSWKEAEKLLVKSSDKHHTAVINYLCAATCAQKQGKIAMRDDYLRLAHDSDSRADLAIGITQARLQLESGQLEQGLATLKRLHRIAPSHDFILELLEQVLVQLKDWEGLIDILPSLKHRHLLPEQTVEQLTQRAYLGLLQQCTTDADKKFVWQKVPAEWRLDADMLMAYLPVLIHENDMLTAESLIKNSLKKTWDIRLVEFYGLVQGTEIDRQIKTAEAWQKPHPEDPAILLCLGRLYGAKQIWGHAKELLEMSLSIKPSPQTHFALARVYEGLGEKDKAARHDELGLKMCVVI